MSNLIKLENNEYEQITEKEVIDDFYNNFSIVLSDYLSDITDKMNKNAYPILNNSTKTCNNDFLEFILFNINLEKMYKKNLCL
jgi:hypothetical protein